MSDQENYEGHMSLLDQPEVRQQRRRVTASAATLDGMSDRFTGKIRRGQSVPERSRRGLRPEDGPFVEDGHLFTIIQAIDEIARETGKSVTQIALNWLLQRPTVASLIIGARNETQLLENFGAIGWALTPEQIQRLDQASRVIPTYPYWYQEGFAERNPFPTL